MTGQSALLLRKQLADLNKNPVEGFSAGLVDDNDIFQWEVVVIGPQDTLFEGGFFKATLTFPRDYPLRPPKMKFITEIWHPNVAKNGDVCISILHEPGEDKYGYEKPEERWLPIHTVETIMISVISMLADPNGDSPANVDAAVSLWPGLDSFHSKDQMLTFVRCALQKEWRDDPKGIFKKKVARCVRKSQEMAFD
ncbi:ubiquitin-conjugating enzyme E2 G1-like isoform X1 [Hippocampus comes]|uniref:ubiquitin-conjugating enzyme E2 G1-like isoform X1 n=1 Tax=Hippocampus comes TaxID=109280 RepID=UPI00094EA516|nr:PREDICTED: ubiquitin-conjugating enzyme E2 G1-like isoform X1 [Hippocampus comes]